MWKLLTHLLLTRSVFLTKSQLKLLLTLCHGPAGALKKLTLHGNQLNEVSPALGQLQQLQELMLQGNQLRSIPPELFQMQVSFACVLVQVAHLRRACGVLDNLLLDLGLLVVCIYGQSWEHQSGVSRCLGHGSTLCKG